MSDWRRLSRAEIKADVKEKAISLATQTIDILIAAGYPDNEIRRAVRLILKRVLEWRSRQLQMLLATGGTDAIN